jgi:hypothetical protein
MKARPVSGTITSGLSLSLTEHSLPSATKRTNNSRIESQLGILNGGLFAAQFTLCKKQGEHIF